MAKSMNKLMKQAQKMQAQMLKAQEELNQKAIEGSAGGGMVKVVINGAQELQSVSINPEVVDPEDVEMLEDLIVAAFKNAQQEAKQLSDSTFGGITGGLGMPGM